MRVMTEIGYKWYPEYTFEEQFHDFNQSQFICKVRIFTSYPGATEPLHWSYGLGITVGMSVQDAAYSMISIIRAGYASLQNTEFRYLPAAHTSQEGCYIGLYVDASHEDPRLCTTTKMLEERDRENRALRMELYNTRGPLGHPDTARSLCVDRLP